jgi:hypothetical protein
MCSCFDLSSAVFPLFSAFSYAGSCTLCSHVGFGLANGRNFGFIPWCFRWNTVWPEFWRIRKLFQAGWKGFSFRGKRSLACRDGWYLCSDAESEALGT